MQRTKALTTALTDEILRRLYGESLPRIQQCLSLLDDQQIWWRPNPSSNAIGNLVLHLAGNVNQWICSGLGGLPDSRRRQLEFDTPAGPGRDELLRLLTHTLAEAEVVIRSTTEDDLLRIRPVQTFEESGMSILIHVAEHFSYHTGQIAYITKMLTDRPLGFYDGIALS